MNDDKLIVYVDKDGHEKVIVMDWRKRKVAGLTVTFSPAPEQRQVERILRGLEDGLAGGAVAVTHAETEEEFIARHADALVPADARESRIVTRAARDAEILRRTEAERRPFRPVDAPGA